MSQEAGVDPRVAVAQNNTSQVAANAAMSYAMGSFSDMPGPTGGAATGYAAANAAAQAAAGGATMQGYTQYMPGYGGAGGESGAPGMQQVTYGAPTGSRVTTGAYTKAGPNVLGRGASRFAEAGRQTFTNSAEPGRQSGVQPLNHGTGYPGSLEGAAYPNVANSEAFAAQMQTFQHMAQVAGYDPEKAGVDPRNGYPLVYPYTPIQNKAPTLARKTRGACC